MVMKKAHFLKKRKSLFKMTSAEHDFWQEQDSTHYIDWSKAKNAQFPNLKSSLSLRLPESLLNELRF
jgi:CopG antitoxin of type II toxin-antitoxin system